MRVHLFDGTYELFRSFYGAPPAKNAQGREVGATRGFLRSLWSFLKTGAVTHGAYAFDTVIESFRNDLYAGYKTGEGIDPDLFAQFPLVERAAHALGMTVWSMIEFEADDGIASGVRLAAADKRVKQVVICSPDKDMAQCVDGDRVVMFDRHRDVVMNASGVESKFGVKPASIPDWLALVGDTADGYPGVPRWGAKSASTVLAAYERLEKIPVDSAQWTVKVRGADGLAANLAEHKQEALLFRKLATLRYDAPISTMVDELAWLGARKQELQALCQEIGESDLMGRIDRWAP